MWIQSPAVLLTSQVNLPNHFTSLSYISYICKNPHQSSTFSLEINLIMVTQKTR